MSARSVYYWIDTYARDHDPSVLRDGDRAGRPSLWATWHQQLLRSLLGRSPQQLGYFAVDWTVNRHLVFTGVTGVNVPGKAARQFTGGSKVWSTFMLYMGVKF